MVVRLRLVFGAPFVFGFRVVSLKSFKNVMQYQQQHPIEALTNTAWSARHLQYSILYGSLHVPMP